MHLISWPFKMTREDMIFQASFLLNNEIHFFLGRVRWIHKQFLLVPSFDVWCAAKVPGWKQSENVVVLWLAQQQWLPGDQSNWVLMRTAAGHLSVWSNFLQNRFNNNKKTKTFQSVFMWVGPKVLISFHGQQAVRTCFNNKMVNRPSLIC